MMECKLFLILPFELLRSIFAEYLPIDSVGTFDVAMSSTQHRAEYLKILKTIFQNELCGVDSENYWNWLTKREIKITNLYCDSFAMNFVPMRPRETFRHVRHIKFLKIPFTPLQIEWFIACIAEHDVVDLNFEQCFLNAEMQAAIASCPALTHLTIRSTLELGSGGVGGGALKVMFQEHGKILHINLEGCHRITFKDCSDLVKRFPGRIETLTIGNIPGLAVGSEFSDEKVESVFSQLRNLTSLSLTFYVLLSDHHLQFILRVCPRLKHLDVSYCTKLTNDSLLHISGFISLNLDVPLISCDVLIAIIRQCPALKHLTVGNSCDDLVLINLGRHCRDLREFLVSQGRHITVTGVMSLLHNCRLLERVQIRNAELITSSDFNHIAESTSKCPFLQVVQFEVCQPFPLKGILSLIWNCSNLTKLSFNFDTDVDIIRVCRILSHQARALRSLRFAVLSFEQQLRDLKRRDVWKEVAFDALGFVLTNEKMSCRYLSSEIKDISQPLPKVPLAYFVVDLNGVTRARLTGLFPSDTVHTIKLQVEAQTGVQPEYQRLVQGGKVLNFEETLSSLNLPNHSSIQLFVKDQKASNI